MTSSIKLDEYKYLSGKLSRWGSLLLGQKPRRFDFGHSSQGSCMDTAVAGTTQGPDCALDHTLERRTPRSTPTVLFTSLVQSYIVELNDHPDRSHVADVICGIFCALSLCTLCTRRTKGSLLYYSLLYYTWGRLAETSSRVRNRIRPTSCLLVLKRGSQRSPQIS
jgi:hypothetical protein